MDFKEYVFKHHNLNIEFAKNKTIELNYNEWYGSCYYHIKWDGAPDYCYITELEGLLAAQDDEFSDLSKWDMSLGFGSFLTGGNSSTRLKLLTKYNVIKLQEEYNKQYKLYLNDGITHINIYSKGQTKLGQFLSNFSKTPFVHPEDGKFDSIEGYWYWLSSKDDFLRTLSGYLAKEYGRKIGAKDWLEDELFKNKIKLAIRTKINTYTKMRQKFIDSCLPFKHYYVYKDKVVNVPKANWLIEYIENLRKELTT